MKGAYFIVGPSAVGKTEIAVEVARRCEGEVVSADAFQVYAGLDLLTAKPAKELLRAVPHHLIGTVLPTERMNAEDFRREAMCAIRSVKAGSKPAFVVGGSGLYVKAVTHGLSPLPRGNPALRAQLDQCTERELFVRLQRLDPTTARAIDVDNKRRLIRALEICLLTRRPASEQRQASPPCENRRVSSSFATARTPGSVSTDWWKRCSRTVWLMKFGTSALSETAEKGLGLAQIRELIAGRISEEECIAQIQQARGVMPNGN